MPDKVGAVAGAWSQQVFAPPRIKFRLIRSVVAGAISGRVLVSRYVASAS
jgi:hypothetical protein